MMGVVVNVYDTKNWALSHFGWGSRTEKLRHAVEGHWCIGPTEIEQRAKKKHGDVSVFCHINNKGLEGIFSFFLKTSKHQEMITRWMNNWSDNNDMIFIHNFGHSIGECWRYDKGGYEPCTRAIIILCKQYGSIVPVVKSCYPVPKDYRVRPQMIATRYAKK